MNGRLSWFLIAISGAGILAFHLDMKKWPAFTPRPNPESRPAAVMTGKKAPDFTLPLLSGGTFKLTDSFPPPSFSAPRIIVLNFFATWCDPCRQEFPELVRFYEENKDRVTFLAVNAGESRDAVESFAREYRLPFPVGMDTGAVQTLYRVNSFPTTIVINESGTVLLHETGMIRNADISLKPFLDDTRIQQ